MKQVREVATPYLTQKKQKTVDQTEIKLRKLLRNPLVEQFRKKHPHLPDAVYRQSLLRLKQYVEERVHCQQCPGLQNCPNLIKGHYPSLQEYSGYLDLHMNECRHLQAEREEKKRQSLLQYHRIPEDIQKASIADIQLDPFDNRGREQAIEAAIEFSHQLPTGKPCKGLYLHGPFGVGKSYIAGAIMNELAKFGIGSLMIHTSELFGELRRSINENRLQELIDILKSASVLILDDIGSESLTPWIRDDVLSVVFHHRMADRLPIIFTSNLSMDELEEYFSYTVKGGEEPIKGLRIMERIRHTVKAIHVHGRNRRYDR